MVHWPAITGAWRLGIDVDGAASARGGAVLDQPWRFALLRDGCDANSENVGMPAHSGRYTITGFFKLNPGDDDDVTHFHAGMVQEGVAWYDGNVRCE